VKNIWWLLITLHHVLSLCLFHLHETLSTDSFGSIKSHSKTTMFFVAYSSFAQHGPQPSITPDLYIVTWSFSYFCLLCQWDVEDNDKTNRMLSVSAWYNGSFMEGPHDKGRTSTKCWSCGFTGHCGKQEKKIHRIAPPHVKTSQPNNRLDCRGR